MLQVIPSLESIIYQLITLEFLPSKWNAYPCDQVVEG
jgi:hypothetical protein